MNTTNSSLDQCSTEANKELVVVMKGLSIDKFFDEYGPNEISKAFMSMHSRDKPGEQIMSIAEAVFDLIDANEDDMPPHLVTAFWHLQQSFRVYESLILKG